MTHLASRIFSKLIPLLALAGCIHFFTFPLRTGWTQPATDFPNYYTAAVLARKGAPLRHYYNWTWFQRQMNYAGFEAQLGSYAAQTPLTMLPMMPFAQPERSTQNAKQIWLACSLVLLAVTIAMLSRASQIRWDAIALLMFCGYGSLSTNFIYAQYYVLLLFLITLTHYMLARALGKVQKNQATASGVVAGVTLGLKLYTAPFLLYFAAKRQWRCVAAMLIAIAGSVLIAIALFGWNDIWFYATTILPRSLEGGSIDPYHPGNPTLSTFLRRALVSEPQLNPHPLWNAPWLFFFLNPVVRIGLLAFTAMAIARSNTDEIDHGFAQFALMLLLLSSSIGSYTWLLLLFPVTILLKDAPFWKQVFLVACYILLNIPLQPLWLFPKVWLLLALFIVAGKDQLRSIPLKWAAAAGAFIVLISLVDATIHMRAYADEPGRRYPQIASNSESLLASYPAITKFGLFYQCMGSDKYYVLCWSHDGHIEKISSEGQALQPQALSINGPIEFEFVANRKSSWLQFDPVTRKLAPSPTAPNSIREENRVQSPDGKWIADVRGQEGSRQLWVTDAATGKAERLAGGKCDSAYPAWELDSSSVIFASDCGRAYGLPALYRAPIADRHQ